MTTITCDTTIATDGHIHAVIFHPIGLQAWTDWAGVDIGSTLTLVDEDTGATRTGTLVAFVTSESMPNTPLAAIRIELAISPG